MVIGNRHMDDARLIEWCRSLGCVCISVEYRLAPEAPYPAPLDDCEAGLRFVVEHAHDLRIDRQRIGIGGRSAGGALAAGLALRCRDRANVALAFQYLEYPMLDDRGLTRVEPTRGIANLDPGIQCLRLAQLSRRPVRHRRRASGCGASTGDRIQWPATGIHRCRHGGLSARRVDRFRRPTMPGGGAHRIARLCRRGTWLRHVRRHRGRPNRGARQRGLAGPPVRPANGCLGGSRFQRRREPLVVQIGIAEQNLVRLGPAMVEMQVVFPGDADTAVHLEGACSRKLLTSARKLSISGSCSSSTRPCPASVPPSQQQCSPGGTAAGGDDCNPGVGDLSFGRLAAQLRDGFGQEAESVGPSRRQLTTMGIQR